MSGALVKKDEPLEGEWRPSKVVRGGMVAVLYSPGYGAGWYTWNLDTPYGTDIIFDPEMVQAVESGDKQALRAYVDFWYPETYTGGLESLTIAWVPEGALFRIEEHDGYESIHTLTDPDFIRA